MTKAINTDTNLFDPHFMCSGTTFLRIWSKGGNFLIMKKESNTVKGARS
jgi:hypothetical protein